MPPIGTSTTSGLNQGTISAQNSASPNGNAVTANSTVSCNLGGSLDTIAFQITGSYTGNLTAQVQLDGNAWVDLTGATSLINTVTGLQSAQPGAGAVGVWQVDISGFSGFRLTAKGAAPGGTGAVVTIIGGIGGGVIGLDTPIQSAVNSNSGASVYSVNSAASVNAASVKGSAGAIYNAFLNNATAAAKYVRLYNKATAPTVGTDVPVAVITLLANTSKEIDFSPIGNRFTTGIAIAITNAAGVLDATAVAAGDVQIEMNYA